MSAAFYLQTDGQTERANQVLEAYLRPFLSQDQKDRVGLLPVAEFAYNNSAASVTGVTPFFANYGRHPAANNPRSTEASYPAPHAYTHWFRGDIERAGTALDQARTRMAKNLEIKRPSKKLDHKFLGPFQIERVISPSAVQLALPQRWRAVTAHDRDGRRIWLGHVCVRRWG